MSDAGELYIRVRYLEAVLGAIAYGIAFRGVADPQEIARRTLEKDWPDE